MDFSEEEGCSGPGAKTKLDKCSPSENVVCCVSIFPTYLGLSKASIHAYSNVVTEQRSDILEVNGMITSVVVTRDLAIILDLSHFSISVDFYTSHSTSQ